MTEPEKNECDLFHSSSFEILNKYGSRCRRLNDTRTNYPSYETENSIETTSCVESIIRLAAEKFIQSSSECNNHPYQSSIFNSEEVQLVQILLCCAEKVSEKMYDRARKLLVECDRMSSCTGTPIQRLIFYFTEALHEKIYRETGIIPPKGLAETILDPFEALKSVDDEILIAFHQELPLSQVTKFSGIQAAVDNIADARKIHFIDFDIKKGIQCTILMQALAARSENPVEQLKITAVGVKSKSRTSIEETGRQLTSFAQSLNLKKFSFNAVIVEDITDLDRSPFERDEDEVIAIYAAFTLTHMIGRPHQLEHLMRVIRAINPRVMIITEVEGNCNSPTFVDRFVEALFFYGAYFESMADCMKNDEKHRFFAESSVFSSSIKNVVATEGDERKIRHVGISVWRAFFERFGFEEIELSMSSLYQARLVVKNFSCGDSFTFDIDGKSLIIGWKGTPISSLSAWKLKYS
ncbi:hypothetical protein BUALT_Bualt14G0124900 [Buddleja alternifolia]|uniref:Uncharacterized protein n=1 Tax=Buddleja alternifolia TaxID=168488 RepID=A0AAV6WU42_9LAMI|nr:hypothetical protein BUALT_Bualt14G0124900 [Buddleja alternifolia]